VKNGKRNEKITRKRISCLAGPGGILAHPGASARAGAAGPAARGKRRGRRCGAGPTCQRGGKGLTARTTTEGGGIDRSSTDGGIPRRFSAVGPVPRRGGGGEARAGAGVHRGGVNLTGGGLGRPVRGAVAGVHGGEVAGEAVGCNRGRGGVPRDRERVAKLKH
jgi:hypothetical protein